MLAYQAPHHSSMMTLMFLRHENLSVTNGAFMALHLDSRAISYIYDEAASTTRQQRAIDLITTAISRWIEQTDEGKRVWEASSEDINVGDIANYSLHTDPTLAPFLMQQGVEIVSLTTFGDYPEVDFDEVLASPALDG